MTARHILIYCIVLRHRCSVIIRHTSPFDTVSSITSPFSFLYSFFTLCRLYYWLTSRVRFLAKEFFPPFADYPPLNFGIINARHVLFVHYLYTSLVLCTILAHVTLIVLFAHVTGFVCIINARHVLFLHYCLASL